MTENKVGNNSKSLKKRSSNSKPRFKNKKSAHFNHKLTEMKSQAKITKKKFWTKKISKASYRDRTKLGSKSK